MEAFGPSATFLASSRHDHVYPGQWGCSGEPVVVPNSALWRVFVQPEQVVETLLDRVDLGEYPPGPGTAPVSLVEQDGLLDPTQLREQFSDAHGKLGPISLSCHEAGGHQCEHAVKGVDADLLVRPVEHRVEGDNLAVLHLAEVGFDFGLGAVAGHHLGDAPLVAVGEDDPFAEQLIGQCGLGPLIAPPDEAELCGLGADQACRDDPGQPPGSEDLLDLGLDFDPGLTSLASGQSGGELGELAPGLGQGLFEPSRLFLMEALRVGDYDAVLVPEDDLSGLEGTESKEPLSVHHLVATRWDRQQV